MKRFFSCFLFSLTCHVCFAQSDFVGLVTYKLSVLGSADTHMDSMTVVFDKERVMVILYIPEADKTVEQLFIDDFSEQKSYRIDKAKQTFQSDSLKNVLGYNFKNSNSIGAVNNALCIRYKADLSGKDKTLISSAECLASIDYRKSSIKDYCFLGVQPIVVDNRIVMDFTVNNTNGTRPNITVSDVRKLDNVDKYFDLWGYREIK